MTDLAALIAQVRHDQAKHGEASQPPASAEQIAVAQAEVAARFGAALPAGYAEFLRLSDGLNHDGVFLYGATQSPGAPGAGGFWQGVVAANAAWREGPGHDRYLVLGETDMDLLTVDLDGNAPVLRDKISGDVVERFGSVSEAIERVVRARL